MKEVTWHSDPVDNHRAVYGHLLEIGEIIAKGDLMYTRDKGWISLRTAVGGPVMRYDRIVRPVDCPYLSAAASITPAHVDALESAIHYAGLGSGLSDARRTQLISLLRALAPQSAYLNMLDAQKRV